jgi:hypothetical protein
MENTQISPEFRTVRLYLTFDEQIAINEYTGNRRDLEAAIGYLSTWGLTHPYVNIYLRSKADEPPELLAVYTDEEGGQAKFVIGAVWDTDNKRFGFHS